MLAEESGKRTGQREWGVQLLENVGEKQLDAI